MSNIEQAIEGSNTIQIPQDVQQRVENYRKGNPKAAVSIFDLQSVPIERSQPGLLSLRKQETAPLPQTVIEDARAGLLALIPIMLREKTPVVSERSNKVVSPNAAIDGLSSRFITGGVTLSEVSGVPDRYTMYVNDGDFSHDNPQSQMNVLRLDKLNDSSLDHPAPIAIGRDEFLILRYKLDGQEVSEMLGTHNDLYVVSNYGGPRLQNESIQQWIDREILTAYTNIAERYNLRFQPTDLQDYSARQELDRIISMDLQLLNGVNDILEEEAFESAFTNKAVEFDESLKPFLDDLVSSLRNDLAEARTKLNTQLQKELTDDELQELGYEAIMKQDEGETLTSTENLALTCFTYSLALGSYETDVQTGKASLNILREMLTDLLPPSYRMDKLLEGTSYSENQIPEKFGQFFDSKIKALPEIEADLNTTVTKLEDILEEASRILDAGKQKARNRRHSWSQLIQNTKLAPAIDYVRNNFGNAGDDIETKLRQFYENRKQKGAAQQLKKDHPEGYSVSSVAVSDRRASLTMADVLSM